MSNSVLMTTLEATALTNLGEAFKFVTGTGMSGMVTLMLGEPILLIPVAVAVAGAGIGLASRLIH